MFLTLALDRSGLLHALEAFPGEEPSVPFGQKWVSPRPGLKLWRKEKSLASARNRTLLYSCNPFNSSWLYNLIWLMASSTNVFQNSLQRLLLPINEFKYFQIFWHVRILAECLWVCSVCQSICMYEPAPEPLGGFPWNLTLENFKKNCQKVS
jgi:hypothetical protein